MVGTLYFPEIFNLLFFYVGYKVYRLFSFFSCSLLLSVLFVMLVIIRFVFFLEFIYLYVNNLRPKDAFFFFSNIYLTTNAPLKIWCRNYISMLILIDSSIHCCIKHTHLNMYDVLFNTSIQYLQ